MLIEYVDSTEIYGHVNYIMCIGYIDWNSARNDSSIPRL